MTGTQDSLTRPRILLVSFFEQKSAKQAMTAMAGKYEGVQISFISEPTTQLMLIHESPDPNGEDEDNHQEKEQSLKKGHTDVHLNPGREEQKRLPSSQIERSCPCPSPSPSPNPSPSPSPSPSLDQRLVHDPAQNRGLNTQEPFQGARTLPLPPKTGLEVRATMAATLRGEKRLLLGQSSPSESSFEWDGLNERYVSYYPSAASTRDQRDRWLRDLFRIIKACRACSRRPALRCRRRVR